MPNSTKSGQSSARQWNGVSVAGRWWPNIECWFGSFVIFQGIRTNIAKKPYIFVIFQGGGTDPCPPLWIRAWRMYMYQAIIMWAGNALKLHTL